MHSVMLLLASRSLSTFIIDKVSLGGSLSPGMLKLCNSCCAEFACHLIPCLRSEMLPNQLDPREHLLSWCLLFGLLFVPALPMIWHRTLVFVCVGGLSSRAPSPFRRGCPCVVPLLFLIQRLLLPSRWCNGGDSQRRRGGTRRKHES